MIICGANAPASADLLLRELDHRIGNGLAAAINLISAAAIRADGAEAKTALSDVVELLYGYADVQRALVIPRGKALIDAAGYIRRWGSGIRRALLDRMKIQLAFATEALPMQPERCSGLGLIVHDLVTNAVRHSCSNGRPGEIKIKLRRIGALVNCLVVDNGSRSPRRASARGLRISTELAKALNARIETGFGVEFTSVILSFQLTEREQRANRAVASRCARPLRRPIAIAPGASSLVRGSKRQPVHDPVSGLDANVSPTRHGELAARSRPAEPLGELLSPSHRMDAQ